MLALALAGCTVDVGPQADAAACMPSTDYFASDVWPRYVVPNQCNNLECHDIGERGHGTLRFRAVGATPAPGTPIDQWAPEWQHNYYAAIQLVDCASPTDSRLLTMPEGIGNLHPPGPVVVDRAAARAIFETWLEASQ